MFTAVLFIIQTLNKVLKKKEWLNILQLKLKAQALEPNQPSFNALPLTKSTQAKDFNALCLHFLIYKMEVIAGSTSKD